MMKELFDQLKSITDIFTIGRLIFYPFAGALVVVPFYLFARVLLVSPEALLYTQLTSDLQSLGYFKWSPEIFILSSIVIGFLVVVAGFPILDRAGAEISKQLDTQTAARSTSFSYNYPLLRQKKDEDYATWLISEYFRYVEIATYIPLGGMIGLVLMMLYVLVFVVRQFGSEAASGGTAHFILMLLLSAVIIIKWYLWPEVWVKRVILPILTDFLRAKANLIEGVKVVDHAVGPFTARAPDKPAPSEAKSAAAAAG